MNPPIPLSRAALRTEDSPISELMSRALAAPDLVSLAAGFVDQATLPVDITAEAAATILGDEVQGHKALQYGTTIGDRKLRERLIEHLESSEGVASGTYSHCLHRTVITTGSQQLLYLVGEALLDPNDIVLVESPTYFVFLNLLKTRGARVVGIETDDEGLRPDRLEEALAEIEARGDLHRVKLIYTIPEHANPTGLSLAEDRRAELVRIAERWSKHQRIYILEDSAYRGLNFEGAEPPSVWSLDESGETVILARTFSKTFSPGLKTGYGIVPEALLRSIVNLKGSHDFGSSNFNQQLLERILEQGHYPEQIARLRAAYREKRDALLSALEEHLGGTDSGVSWTEPKGGIYVWLTLPEGVETGRDSAFFARCLEHGVLYVPGQLCYPDEPVPAPKNQARLTFGVAAGPQLAEGAKRLAAALADCLAPVA